MIRTEVRSWGRSGLLLVFAVSFALALGPLPDDWVVVTAAQHHLGDDSTPEWTETTPEPEGVELVRTFEAQPGREYTLAIEQRDVHRSDWGVRVGERDIATLVPSVERRTEYYSIPADTLAAGENRLAIVAGAGDDGYDDIVVGPIRVYPGSVRAAFDLVPLRIEVRERASAAPLPARLTIVTADGTLAPIWFGERDLNAVRTGVAYTLDGSFAAELSAGRYTVWASKGVEWSRARAELVVERGGTATLAFELERQVDTTGFVAADTHLHTFTISRHGDATIEERIVTLAAEGVELAIATDHNHQLDYAPYQEALGAQRWFTPVVGNEVSTRNGHFNAFPLPADGPLPNHELRDWVALVENIRSTGAAVVILNHPRWPYEDNSPFALAGFEPLSGERDGPRFTFDCLELVNSTCVMEDPLSILADWFGVLNGGERVFAVGSSDSHSVADPVGQGRTYVASSTDDAAAIDVAEACRSFQTGRVTTSYGIVTDLALARGDERVGLGGLLSLPEPGAAVVAQVRVAAPDWVRPRSVRLYANGVEVARADVPTVAGRPTDVTLALDLELRGDAHVVAAVLGDPVDEPFWHALNEGYTFASTNPVFVDADGDGQWTDPNARARALLARRPLDGSELARDASLDAAVWIQILRLARSEVDVEPEARAALLAVARARGAGPVADYLARTH